MHDSRNALPRGQKGCTPKKTLLKPGTAKMPPTWGYVGPSWGYVGAMLAHLGSMLGPSSPILSYVVFMSSPSFPNFALKSFSQWPARHPLHFCNTISLKKLNPAWDGHTPDERLKAPTSGLRWGKGHRGDPNDASYAVGGPGRLPRVAEAKNLTVQATTSLTLHGMAGLIYQLLYGLRPAPAMPGQEMDREG